MPSIFSRWIRAPLCGVDLAREVGEALLAVGRASPRARRAVSPRIGASLRAAPTGSLTRNGVAKIVEASSETASSVPWRSVIVPRLAIRSPSRPAAWRRRLLQLAALEREQVARRAASRARAARGSTANSRPMRRSIRRVGRDPRLRAARSGQGDGRSGAAAACEAGGVRRVGRLASGRCRSPRARRLRCRSRPVVPVARGRGRCRCRRSGAVGRRPRRA